MKHDELEPVQIQKQVLDYLTNRFGLDRTLFQDYELYMGSKNRIYLGPKHIINEAKIVTLGIAIARADGGIKPTTNLFQIFGHEITKNFIELTKEQTITYVKGDDMRFPETPHTSDGYVLLKYAGYSLGCGLLKDKILKNMMPKAKRLNLKYI